MEVFDATVRAEEEGDISLLRADTETRQRKARQICQHTQLLCLSTTLLIRENSVLSKEQICVLRDVFHFVSISV